MRYNPHWQSIELDREWEKNYFPIQGEDFFLEQLDGHTSRKGGNSCVYRATDADNDRAYIVKFCRYTLTTRQKRERLRVGRFLREISALEKARDSLFAGCVITIVDKGSVDLQSVCGRERIHYYVMTEADCDLRSFLEQTEIDLPQKLHLCQHILGHLRDLHALGIYHRDIKPENIFMISGRPVFGDLGLVNYREKDQDMDGFYEKIGPVGFLSPEAANKCLGIRGRSSFRFDCWIDDKSDVFQLGQLFWLILQDEVPTGHLALEDVRFTHTRILSEIISPMLQYGKQRRANVASVGVAMEPILRELALV
jgi:serine/threonine protein kinase